jgi:two-component system sensor histidine kinase/response regulator
VDEITGTNHWLANAGVVKLPKELKMRIRYKLLAGLLGIPVIFAGVAILLIIANSHVQRDAREVATYQTTLGVLSAQLSEALIVGHDAAEVAMAEKQRARLEPEEKDTAEKGAGDAEAEIIRKEASIDEILDLLTDVTQRDFQDGRQSGNEADAANEAEELNFLGRIRTESHRYEQLLKKYVAVIDTNPNEANEILYGEIDSEYKYRLYPLVVSYASARNEEVTGKASQIEKSIARLTVLIAGSAIGALLLATLIALFLSRSFSQPLKRLAGAARDIGAGRLGSKIQIESDDEIGELAGAFNQMADDLSRTTVSKDYVDGIIKSMGDSLVVASSEGCMVTVNAATCRLLGYTEAELIGQPLQMLFANCESLSRESPQDDGVSNVESVYLAKDGRVIPIVFSRTSLQTGAGGAPAVVCVAKDITELKRVTEAVRQSEQKLSVHIQRTPLAVIEWNLNAEIVDWNPAAEAVFGFSKQDVLGRQIAGLLVAKSGREHAALEWNELLSQKVGQDITCENLTKDGRAIICEWHNTPLDSKGEVIGVASIVQDFTERTEMEKDLREARDAALESVRLKSEFLATMSHEIRTPMNGIIGMTGLLLDTELEADQREFAETISSSADSLLSIINDILDFSKIEAGKLQFETVDFDLVAVVERTVELLSAAAVDKKIELASLIYSDVPNKLCGDPGRLRQVLTNLLGNAVKFTEQGEVVVKVERQVETETETEIVIRFEVKDTGIGMSDAELRNLFQAFRQADGSTTREYGGTGLGLAISKQLVEMMGGQIGVRSAKGKGSTFWFTAKFGKQPPTSPVGPISAKSIEKLRVLIVGDNATNRTILSHQLSSWGMIPEEADSGVAALSVLRSAAVQADLAILDLTMPGMDGFELARRIKSDPQIAGIRLILLTSFGYRGQRHKAREAGIDEYLAKPVRQSQLFDCVTAVMGNAITRALEKPAPLSSQLVTKNDMAEAKPVSDKLILFAEDNMVNQRVVVRQLKKLGYRADTVANGREALEALERTSYDLVLMDCQMPKMDGYEATAAIRQREGQSRHTPIIAVTANAMAGDREKCLAAGMDEYLSKPVNSEKLHAILVDWLSGSAQVATAAVIP